MVELLPTSKPNNTKLTPVERTAIRLAGLQGYSRTTIALAMKCSTNAVININKLLSANDNQRAPESIVILRELARADLGALDTHVDLVEALIDAGTDFLANRLEILASGDRRQRFTKITEDQAS